MLRGKITICMLLLMPPAYVPSASAQPSSLTAIDRQVQPKIVKLYGSGGFKGLEAYQSGMLVSAQGHILTVWSYVLDDDEVLAVLDDGRRFQAKLVASDPLTEIAVLKFDPGGETLPHFNLADAATAESGARVLAFSNLFGIATGDEAASMLQGVVSAVAPLEARRGAFATNYHGDVYVLDAGTNNPGAAGGALTDSRGRLLGMLGKELRSSMTGTWLNYAFPVPAFAPAVDEIIAGRFTPPKLTEVDRPDNPLSLVELGIVLVPDVVNRTPPYIDRVIPDSAAARAGLRPDDLVVMIDSQVASSCRDANQLIQRLEQDAEIRLSVLREDELLEVTLNTKPAASPNEESPAEEPSAEESEEP